MEAYKDVFYEVDERRRPGNVDNTGVFDIGSADIFCETFPVSP
jgi:hypothetical protein